MKKLLVLLFLLTLSVAHAQELKTYTILKGSNFCKESTIKNLGAVKGIEFTVILDSTLIINLGSTEANNAAQKLFGISFGTNNHNYSWRLAYSIASIPNKKLYLRNYMYNSGYRINTKFGATNQKVSFINGVASFSGTVSFNYESNTISLSIPAYNINQEFEFDFSRASRTCYQQFFYWEGSHGEGAPKTLKIKVAQKYLY